MTGPYDSYQAMHLVYRRVTNSLSTPFAFFPKYPPLLPSRQEISELRPTTLPANHGLNESRSSVIVLRVVVFTSLPLLTARG